MLDSASQINKKLGNTSATEKLVEIITKEEIFPYFKKIDSKGPDWKLISTSLTKKYPKQKDEVLLKGKVSYNQKIKDWTNFGVLVQQYMQKYGQNATPAQLNGYAWTVFENCKDKNIITAALEWSKKSCETIADPAYMDTYANLLYKLGKKEQALMWEDKALLHAGEEEKVDYKNAIDKMNRGEKTWKE